MRQDTYKARKKSYKLKQSLQRNTKKDNNLQKELNGTSREIVKMDT